MNKQKENPRVNNEPKQLEETGLNGNTPSTNGNAGYNQDGSKKKKQKFRSDDFAVNLG